MDGVPYDVDGMENEKLAIWLLVCGALYKVEGLEGFDGTP